MAEPRCLSRQSGATYMRLISAISSLSMRSALALQGEPLALTYAGTLERR